MRRELWSSERRLIVTTELSPASRVVFSNLHTKKKQSKHCPYTMTLNITAYLLLVVSLYFKKF